MADKTSIRDGPQHIGRCLGRKTAVLAAVCCLGFLAYILNNCLWSKSVTPQLASTQSGVPIRASGVAAVPGTRKPSEGGAKTQDAPQKDLAQRPKPIFANLEDEDMSIFSSSVDEDDDEEAVESVESATFTPQGAWLRRLPQAIIIGVKKGGTRALLNFLRTHPQVAVSTKEMHYFDRQYDRGIDWYRNAMPYSYANQLTIEKTPGYFVTPEVPQRIRQTMSPDMKFLVVVRNPISRAISDHAQSLSKGKTATFEEKAMLSPQRCEVDDEWSAIRIGLYDEHLSNWLAYYPIGQFLFVNGENLVASPGAEMARVQDFLGIRRAITDRSFVFNETKGFPCLREVGCLGESKGRAHQPVQASVRQCLARFYQPHNERFYKMTGINFHWEDTDD